MAKRWPRRPATKAHPPTVAIEANIDVDQPESGRGCLKWAEGVPPLPLPGKVPAKESLIVRFGFTPARRRALLGLIGLEKADHAHAAWLQKNVIAPHIDRIIDEFYRRLWKNPQAKNILGRDSSWPICVRPSVRIC